MYLQPPLVIKKEIVDLAPGELIRLQLNNMESLALVGVYGGGPEPQKCLLQLSERSDGLSSPAYVFPKWGSMTYLSYGHAYFYDADHTNGSADFSPLRYGDGNGLLLVSAEGVYLAARSMPHSNAYDMIYYEIERFAVTAHLSDHRIVGFRRWKLYLGSRAEQRAWDKPLVSFEAVRQA